MTVGGAACTSLGLGGVLGIFPRGIADAEVGVAGVAGVTVFGAPGISVFTGTALLCDPGRKAGSELSTLSFRSAK